MNITEPKTIELLTNTIRDLEFMISECGDSKTLQELTVFYLVDSEKMIAVIKTVGIENNYESDEFKDALIEVEACIQKVKETMKIIQK